MRGVKKHNFHPDCVILHLRYNKQEDVQWETSVVEIWHIKKLANLKFDIFDMFFGFLSIRFWVILSLLSPLASPRNHPSRISRGAP